MNTLCHPRRDIHYWKCDRPEAFYGIRDAASRRSPEELEGMLRPALARHFPGEPIELRAGQGQGNHVTLAGSIGGRPVFVRIEDGPEEDDYMEVESHLLREVSHLGIPVPKVHASDATRKEVPFAWQVLERIGHPDLNQHQKAGSLDLASLGYEIGVAVARWQAFPVERFGPFDPGVLRSTGILRGFHERYDGYFFCRLESHLDFLVREAFLSPARAAELRSGLEAHRALLARTPGVLVHKDLALWNILGTPEKIAAFIDWDDAVAGDAMDDISLLACFHEGDVIARVVAGYASVRPLPEDYCRRFWLHLLRNMIFKAVIRAGAGYFKRTDAFFLIGAGGSGASLEAATRRRIDIAWEGLRNETDPASL